MYLGINNCQNLLKKSLNHFSKCLKIIYPSVYQIVAEGLKSQLAGLANDLARSDKFFASTDENCSIAVNSYFWGF